MTFRARTVRTSGRHHDDRTTGDELHATVAALLAHLVWAEALKWGYTCTRQIQDCEGKDLVTSSTLVAQVSCDLRSGFSDEHDHFQGTCEEVVDAVEVTQLRQGQVRRSSTESGQVSRVWLGRYRTAHWLLNYRPRRRAMLSFKIGLLTLQDACGRFPCMPS